MHIAGWPAILPPLKMSERIPCGIPRFYIFFHSFKHDAAQAASQIIGEEVWNEHPPCSFRSSFSVKMLFLYTYTPYLLIKTTTVLAGIS